MKKLVLTFIVSLVVLMGCQYNKDLKSMEQVTMSAIALTSINWTLGELNGVKENTTQNEMPVKSMTLHVNDNSVTGFAGCNRFFGRFVAEDLVNGLGKLKFNNIASTKMACMNVEINEQTYFNVLNDTVFYQLDDNSLILLNEALTVLAVFENKK